MIYTFWSVNGGVGKTTLAVNTALKTAIMYPESKVILLDFNLFNPDIDLYLGINKELKYTLEFFVKNQINFKNISKYLIEYKRQKNLKIMPGLYDINFFDKLNSEHFLTLLEYLKKMFDYIFIDINSSLNIDASFVSINSCDKLLIVGKSQHASIRNINRYKSKVLQKMGIENKIEIIINNFRTRFDKDRIFNALGNEVFFIENNILVEQSTHEGKPFVLLTNKKLRNNINVVKQLIEKITTKREGEI